ncbi:MAG: 50S ribosomal protein L7/L12, partial [Candidatus Gottesmanbacteria bacterium GW2011_GWA1_42_26]
MAKLTKDEILKSVEEMTVLELADLVKALEEKF